MSRKILAIGLAAAALGFASSASATVWTSALEYRDNGSGGASQSATPFGLVTIEDGFDGTSAHPDGTTLQITVTLTNADSLFVNTGGPHDPFLYNLEKPATVSIINSIDQNFYDGGRTTPAAFEATPFGLFTNKIGCCSTYIPGQNVVSGWHWEGTGKNKHKVNDYTFVPAHYVENNGAANGIKGPLTFYLHDDNGLTFAGLGAVADQLTGKLKTPGVGPDNHLFSNTGGWWFTADICDRSAPASACTYNVGARDAFRDLTQLPEPGTWALMILGFGGAGAMLRRKRAALAA